MLTVLTSELTHFNLVIHLSKLQQLVSPRLFHRSRFNSRQQTPPNLWARGIWCASGSARLSRSVKLPTQGGLCPPFIPSSKVLVSICPVRTQFQTSFRSPVPLALSEALAGESVLQVSSPRLRLDRSFCRDRRGPHSVCFILLFKFFRSRFMSSRCTFPQCGRW